MSVIILAISWLGDIIVFMLLARAILSWIVNPYNSNPNSFLYKLYAFLTQITEPLTKPFRNLLSRFNTGPIDFSLFLTMIAVMVIEKVLIQILYIFM